MQGYVVPLAVVVFAFAVVTGFLASRKDRDPLLWAVIGGLFPVVGLIILLTMPHICPRCKLPLSKELWTQRTCPFCNSTF